MWVRLCTYTPLHYMYLFVYMYSKWVGLTPRPGSCLQSRRTTPKRSSGVSWLRWSPAACWGGTPRAAGRVSSGGRSSWSTCRTAGSWSASRPCACGSGASARPTGRTSCRSRARYTRRGAPLRKHTYTHTKPISTNCLVVGMQMIDWLINWLINLLIY